MQKHIPVSLSTPICKSTEPDKLLRERRLTIRNGTDFKVAITCLMLGVSHFSLFKCILAKYKYFKDADILISNTYEQPDDLDSTYFTFPMYVDIDISKMLISNTYEQPDDLAHRRKQLDTNNTGKAKIGFE